MTTLATPGIFLVENNMDNYKRQKKYRLKRAIRGLCGKCGRTKVPDGTQCDPCKADLRAGNKVRRLERTAWRKLYHYWKTNSGSIVEYFYTLIKEYEEKKQQVE